MNRFHVRFTLPAACGEQLVTTHDDDKDGGILLVAASTGTSGDAVVLVADGRGLGLANAGASATDGLCAIVSAYRQILCQVLEVSEGAISWVRIDDKGTFDLFKPDGDASVCTGVHWQAIPGAQPSAAGSMAAFLSTFPTLGYALIVRLEVMAGGVLTPGRDGDQDLTQHMTLSHAGG